MIGRRIVLEGIGATFVGWFGSDTVTVEKTPSGVKVEDLPDDRPKFKRRYTCRVNDQVSMKIEISNSYASGSYTTGELDQKNGSWVLFDPDRPADKILDREILPVVQKFCDEIKRLDDAYRRGNPVEFVDEAVVRWRRVSPA